MLALRILMKLAAYVIDLAAKRHPLPRNGLKDIEWT